MLKGDERALSKLITTVENSPEAAEKIIAQILPFAGKSYVLGVTGPSGSGKSTLIKELSKELVSRGKNIGIIAVDPSSKLTGGAFLGDRVRMGELSRFKNIYIRSMATRGETGGVSRACYSAVNLLEAYGKDTVIIETIGVGQDELEIGRIAHTVMVVLSPEFGDEIQFLKAGYLEIGDIYVMNKADMVEAERTFYLLKKTFMDVEKNGWIPPVIKAVAREGKGITEIIDSLEKHREYLKSTNRWVLKEKEKVKREFVKLLTEMFERYVHREINGKLKDVADSMYRREINPFEASKIAFNKLIKSTD